MDTKKKEDLTKQPFFYSIKLKYAFICFILFIILSSKIFYKVISLIINNFFRNIEILNETTNDISFIGILISAFIFSFIIFLI